MTNSVPVSLTQTIDSVASSATDFNEVVLGCGIAVGVTFLSIGVLVWLYRFLTKTINDPDYIEFRRRYM